MAKYVEVINDNGVVSVDDAIERVHRVRSTELADISVTYDVSPSTIYSSEPLIIRRIRTRVITLGSNEEFFAIRAKDNRSKIGFACGFSGGDTVYLYEYINNGGSINDESNFVLDFYGVGQTVVNNVGLQAFDENGGLVFSSGECYENVKGTYNIALDDGAQTRPLDDEKYWPDSISIGSFPATTSAVVISSCKHSHAADWLADTLHVVVFDGSVHLEKRYLIMNLNFDHLNYSILNAGLKYYPPYSMVNSGIIISADGIN